MISKMSDLLNQELDVFNQMSDRLDQKPDAFNQRSDRSDSCDDSLTRAFLPLTPSRGDMIRCHQKILSTMGTCADRLR